MMTDEGDGEIVGVGERGERENTGGLEGGIKLGTALRRVGGRLE